MEQISTYDYVDKSGYVYTSSCLNNKTEYGSNELITIVMDPNTSLIDTNTIELIADLEIIDKKPGSTDLYTKAIAPHNIGDMFIS